MKNIICTVDDKRFATISCDNNKNEVNELAAAKYKMEQEVKENGAKTASYYIPGLIFGDYNYINGEWVCKDRP